MKRKTKDWIDKRRHVESAVKTRKWKENTNNKKKTNINKHINRRLNNSDELIDAHEHYKFSTQITLYKTAQLINLWCHAMW